jgi:calcium-dependent protein kinase
MGQGASKKRTASLREFRDCLVTSHKTEGSVASVFEADSGGALGSGHLGACISVRSLTPLTKGGTFPRYAMKKVKPREMSEEMLEEMQNEIDMLKSVRHPNIVRMYETWEDPDGLYIVLELCAGGTLVKYRPASLSSSTTWSEPEAARILARILGAVSYLHASGLAHRDLKRDNVLFASEDRSPDSVRVIDFGLAVDCSDGKPLTERVGTLTYAAPEVFASSYGPGVDLWSVGVIAYVMLSGELPFDGKSDKVVIKQVRRAEVKFYDDLFEHTSEGAKAFVGALLEKNPKRRLDAQGALAHPWLREHAPTFAALADDVGLVGGGGKAAGSGDGGAAARRRASQLGVTAHVDTLPECILSSLARFATHSALKRAALMCVAASMETEQELEGAGALVRACFHLLDRKRHGWITLRGLTAQLKRQSADAATGAAVLAAFGAMDQDKAGRVDYLEWLAACVESDSAALCGPGQISAAFRRLDEDASGSISVQNLVRALGTGYSEKDLARMHAAASGRGDPDGVISFRAFATMLLPADDEGVGAAVEVHEWLLGQGRVRGASAAGGGAAAAPRVPPS